MGSKSDWETMQEACVILKKLNISYQAQVVSAHRTPDLLFSFSEESITNDVAVIIAGAGGAAHLPGMIASKTTVPVIGVPIKSANLNGLDSLLSIVQMPKGVPVATMSIGKSGAINAALLSASILGLNNPEIATSYNQYRVDQTQVTLADRLLDEHSAS